MHAAPVARPCVAETPAGNGAAGPQSVVSATPMTFEARTPPLMSVALSEPSAILAPVIVPSARSAPRRLASLTLALVIASFLTLAPVTAFFFSCLEPTEFFASWPAANAVPAPRAMNRAR